VATQAEMQVITQQETIMQPANTERMNTTTPQDTDLRDMILKHWHTLPQTLREAIQHDEHTKTVKDATRNMLLSRESIDSVELAAIATLLGIIPYEKISEALAQNKNITERDILRIATHLTEHLFTPHKEALDTLVVNRESIPTKNPTEQKQDVGAVTHTQESVVVKTINTDPAMQKKYTRLAQTVQNTIASGPIAHAYVTILDTYGTDEQHKAALGRHIASVLVGTETMAQFKDTIKQSDLIAAEHMQDFFHTCETTLFAPVRKSILQSLEHRE
jgi:hypothetical protein